MSAARVDLNEPDVLIREIRAVEIDGAAVARIEADGCWTWLRYIDPDGYGRTGRNKAAYRVVYTLAKGPIPEGLVLDHVCRNRACVNPEHLEPVTIAENNRRAGAARTRCRRGHAYTDENTYRTRRGARMCRACHRAASRAYRRRERA